MLTQSAVRPLTPTSSIKAENNRWHFTGKLSNQKDCLTMPKI